MRAQKRALAEAEKLASDHPGWQIKPIRVSKANTAWSPIHHGSGLARELYLSGVQDRDITPDLLTLYGAATGRDGISQYAGAGGQAGGQSADQSDGSQAAYAGAASPGADEGMWDSILGDFGEMA